MPACATRRTVLQKVRGSPYRGVPQLVNTGFQVLFHSPPGVLFTFPSQYYALSVTKEYLALRGGPRAIGHQGVFSLTGWSPLLQSRFLVSRPTLDPAVPSFFSRTGLSPSPAGFSKTIPVRSKDHVRGPNPSMHARWFGLFPFRSPLLRKSSFLSPPPAT